jgi:uncharacterized protein (TIGR00369 family)
MEIPRDFLDRHNGNSLYSAMGIRIEEAADGTAHSRMEIQPAMCWPFPHQPHGGVIFTLMDTTMAWALFSALEKGLNCTTIQLDIQYMSPAKGSFVTCTSWAACKTRRLAFARGEVKDERGQLVAVGQGTFRIIKTDIIG